MCEYERRRGPLGPYCTRSPRDVCSLDRRMPVNYIMYYMPAPRGLKRKSFFVDERALRRARRLLGARSDADVVRMSIERVAEMEEFWRFMARTRGVLAPADFERV